MKEKTIAEVEAVCGALLTEESFLSGAGEQLQQT